MIKTIYYEMSSGKGDVIQIEGRIYRFFYDDSHYVIKTMVFGGNNTYYIPLPCTPENTDFLARVLKVKIDGYKLNGSKHLLKEIS